MEFFPAKLLVFTGESFFFLWLMTAGTNEAVLSSVEDESSFCDKDLLQSFARSEKGTGAQRLVINQNPERWSLLPAISLTGLVALTMTRGTFQGDQFEHFLEFDLLPRMN